MIKKVWAKFDGMDLECVCDEHHRKCKPDKSCKEYVVKFMEIDREQQVEEAVAQLENASKSLQRDMKKFQSKISRSIKKYKI